MNIRDYIEVYDVTPLPRQNQQSFYGKAKIYVDSDGNQTLYSYNVPIVRRTVDGELQKLWKGWTTSTGRHITAFCRMTKKEWDAMPLYEEEKDLGREL